jgi:hypothetical protein
MNITLIAKEAKQAETLGRTPSADCRPAYFLCLVFAVACTFLAPVPKQKHLARAGRAMFERGASVAISGPSFIEDVSRCDADRRDLVQMLAANRGGSVSDLSYGGQTLNESINYAALAVKNPRLKKVVVALSITGFSGWDDQNLNQFMFFRMLNHTLPHESMVQRIRTGALENGHRDPWLESFEYNGRAYPDYNGIKATYFQEEHKSGTCPEQDGVNRDFIEAYYYQNYANLAPRQENFDVVSTLSASARSRGKTIYLVLMPIDFELMEQFNPLIAERAHVTIAFASKQLRLRGVNVLDLTAALPNSSFSDRWCACGHLMDQGRWKVAGLIAQAISDEPDTHTVASVPAAGLSSSP